MIVSDAAQQDEGGDAGREVEEEEEGRAGAGDNDLHVVGVVVDRQLMEAVLLLLSSFSSCIGSLLFRVTSSTGMRPNPAPPSLTHTNTHSCFND